MAKVAVMEFDKVGKLFKFLKEVDLASVPTTGDKVVLDIEGIGYIFEVYDVHYADKQMVDVNVIRISNITDYNSSRFPDIA